MTETTARIRWDDAPARTVHAAIGYVGTISEPAFHIYGPTAEEANWLLSVRIAAGGRFIYADDPDTLKAEAERWLEEFTSSLGAVFPEPWPVKSRCECGGSAQHRLSCRWREGYGSVVIEPAPSAPRTEEG